ncbi:3-hydroxyacyl-CoA dehydrogenase family protein [Sulfitobacter aestuariivivens]|uniref:3-hydroxyacyl-CoA dehydrogenase C-terminal domain-containing protein n=1 Tax=Sulfitobacter aestuariivivens TaxID=2766981 RepID=A0A927D6F4_9RHOB|nr:3-hydroxyacyl-CoA dehydrogenase family protein [Sulfitobacter aestuariivivens]MBD3664679.1 hypothetical protein [Sulfitobacter aestuariivivens]
MRANAAARSVQQVFWRRAEELLLHHTNPWELDAALTDKGFAMGPCEAQDLLGLDKVLAAAGAPALPILPRMVAEGRIGKAGSVGFYRYPGGGGAVIDPLIEDLILEEARFAKVDREPLSDEELVQRMITALRTHLREIGLNDRQGLALLQRAVHFPAQLKEALTG